MQGSVSFEPVTVYVLCEPGTDIVRYVGITKRTIKTRLTQHLSPSHLARKTHLARWLKSLVVNGLKPDVKVVRVVPEHSWEYYEQFYIEHYKALGYSLTNCSAGGMGLLSPPNEVREKIAEAKRGKKREPFSEQARKNMSEAQKGKPKVRTKPVSPEGRRNMSIAHLGNKNGLGHKQSEERKNKTRERMMGNTLRKDWYLKQTMQEIV